MMMQGVVWIDDRHWISEVSLALSPRFRIRSGETEEEASMVAAVVAVVAVVVVVAVVAAGPTRTTSHRA